ncbi:MAG: hypothetical protein CM1200mP18_07760 [Gammaproteobacteria bacterium]|nr:MAG: hypothetical protein CM1200mP18_07760 [Gammaproteobacteria bacterium]
MSGPMSANDHPVVGVIGGMGPDAPVDLMRRVICATPAKDDADHFHLLVDNNPRYPPESLRWSTGMVKVRHQYWCRWHKI